MLYVIAAARSTVFVQDSFNRLYSVYDTYVTTILKVFMKMWHLHSIDCICLSLLFVSRCQHPPWKFLDCKVGLAGVGWSVGSKN